MMVAIGGMAMEGYGMAMVQMAGGWQKWCGMDKCGWGIFSLSVWKEGWKGNGGIIRMAK